MTPCILAILSLRPMARIEILCRFLKMLLIIQVLVDPLRHPGETCTLLFHARDGIHMMSITMSEGRILMQCDASGKRYP